MMLRRVKDLLGLAIRATDGELGKVHDFYFDDQTWAIRYLVVDVGSWLFGRRVLVAASAVGRPEDDANVIPVQLTKDQVEHSPDIDLDKPVERQHEVALSSHYGWPMYWSGDPMLYGMTGGMDALSIAEQQAIENATAAPDKQGDPNLHSIEKVTGYMVQATDGDIGYVNDFILDETAWAIRYILFNTHDWLPGKRVLVAPTLVEQLDWEEAKIHVKTTRDQIKESPAYDPTVPLDSADEPQANKTGLYQSDIF
ncbi:MAG: PRC-barrel domain-containing protein [Chloroflexi bacterium]|nr:PRC-barrel domain-containing protein [Chloroflexota bacterium]